MVLAIDVIDRHDPSNEMRRQINSIKVSAMLLLAYLQVYSIHTAPDFLDGRTSILVLLLYSKYILLICNSCIYITILLEGATVYALL